MAATLRLKRIAYPVFVSIWRKVGVWVAQTVGTWILVMLGCMFFVDAPKGKDYWQNVREAALPMLFFVGFMRFIVPRLWRSLQFPLAQPYEGRDGPRQREEKD